MAVLAFISRLVLATSAGVHAGVAAYFSFGNHWGRALVCAFASALSLWAALR